MVVPAKSVSQDPTLLIGGGRLSAKCCIFPYNHVYSEANAHKTSRTKQFCATRAQFSPETVIWDHVESSSQIGIVMVFEIAHG